MRWTTIAVLLLLIAPVMSAQSVDSLLQSLATAKADTAKVRMLRKLGWKYSLINTDSSLLFYRQSLGLAHSLKAYDGEVLALLGLKSAYLRLGQTDSCLVLIKRAARIAEDYQDPKYISMCLGSMAHYYHEIAYKPDSSIYFFERELEIMRNAGFTYEMWAPYMGRGELYYKLGMNEKAEADILEALHITETKKIRMDYGLVLFRLIRNYFDLHEWDKYSRWTETYINFVKEGDESRDRSSVFHRGLYFFEDDTNAEVVIPILKEIAATHERNKNHSALIDALEYQSGVEWRSGKHSDGIATLKKALALCAQQGNILFQEIYLLRLSEMYEELHNPEMALSYYKQHKLMQDSVEITDNRQHIAELEVRYETARKEDALARQTLELEKRKQANRSFTWLVILLTLLLCALVGFVLLKLRTNRSLAEKNAVISKALEDKELLLHEIHHRVKNNLQVISSLLNLQSHYIEDPSALAAIMEGRNRVTSMSLIHQNLYGKENLASMDVGLYLEKLSDSLFQSYNINRSRVQLVTDVDPVSLDIDMLIPLGLILNELISNALKHAFPNDRAGLIRIALKKREADLVLEVTDDGIGMQEKISESASPSFGMELVRAFTHKLKAKLEVLPQPGVTTRITIPNLAA